MAIKVLLIVLIVMIGLGVAEIQRMRIDRIIQSHQPNTEPVNTDDYISAMEMFAVENLTNYGNVQFFGEIGLGTPVQYFTVQYDTGSSLLYIPSVLCKECEMKNQYNPLASITCRPIGIEASTAYAGDNGVSGWMVNDTLSIAGVQVREQTFLAVTKQFNANVNNQFDGILGLAYKSLAFGLAVPVMYNMIDQGLISNAMVSFYFTNHGLPGSEIIFGGVDRSKFVGPIYGIPVTARKYYQFNLQAIEVANFALCQHSGCSAILDTGTSLIMGSNFEQVYQLHQHIGAWLTESGQFMINCSVAEQSPDIEFVMNGFRFPIAWYQYFSVNSQDPQICISNIGYHSFPVDWVLGLTFQEVYYSIFDMSTNVIGLAKSINWG